MYDYFNVFSLLETKEIKEFNKSEFLNAILKVVQSNQEFLLTGELDIQIAVTKNIVGTGYTKKFKAPKDKEQWRTLKKSIIRIKNKGNFSNKK